MNSATFHHSHFAVSRHSAAHAAASFWHATRTTLEVIVSARHHVEQVRSMRRLLRQSNQCEATNPVRADALRLEAANLVD